VDDEATGLLVPFEPGDDPSREPRDPAAFAAAIAERVNALVRDPARAADMGRAGRAAVIERFAWPAIAEQTVALYRRLAAGWLAPTRPRCARPCARGGCTRNRRSRAW